MALLDRSPEDSEPSFAGSSELGTADWAVLSPHPPTSARLNDRPGLLRTQDIQERILSPA